MTSKFSEEILRVQQALLRLGYSNVGEADGFTGLKTQAAILDFRNRNGLALATKIDKELLEALKTAPPKVFPAEQVTARTDEIAPKVQAVKSSLWTRFWAKIGAVPSLVLAALLGIVQNAGDAINALTPVKSFLQEWLQGIPQLTLLSIGFGAIAVVSGALWLSSNRTGAALTDGYRLGTVRNDLPENSEARDQAP